MFSLKIPFGLQNNCLVTPSEVDRGLACNCTCPGCNLPLVANHPKSSKRVKYFSHYADKSCSTGYETALHLAAKRVLSENKWLLVPGLSCELTLVDKGTQTEANVKKSIEGGRIILDLVEQEVHEYLNIIPDIVAKVGGKTLIIEIAVTHTIDDVKLEKLKKLNFPVLEIYLKPSSYIHSLEEIKNLVLNTHENRAWIVNPKLLELNQQLESDAKKILLERKNEVLEQRKKENEKREVYLRLSDEEKILYELSLLKIDLIDIDSINGKIVNGSDSYGVINHLWQLQIYKEFIHKKCGLSFNREDVLKCLKEKFITHSVFRNSEEVSIYRYLEFLTDKGLIDRTQSNQYVVRRDLSRNNPPHQKQNY